jgi:hypothetical protein
MIVTAFYPPAHPTLATLTLDDPSFAPLVNPHASSTPVSPSRPNVSISERPSIHVVDVHPKEKVSTVPKSPMSKMSTVNTDPAKSTLVNEDSRSRMVPLASSTPNTRAPRTFSPVLPSVPAKSGPSKPLSYHYPKDDRTRFTYNQHCFLSSS